eukprot:10683541-Karenia_brevis.AAC.1
MQNPPAHNATPYERGVYALFVMLLFRPYRSIVNFGLADVPATLASDDAWNLIFTEYQNWRRQLEAAEKKMSGT